MIDMNVLSDAEIKIKGIEALNNVLGASDALKFLRLLHRDPTDYVNISERLYQNQSIDEIFARAKERNIYQDTGFNIG